MRTCPRDGRRRRRKAGGPRTYEDRSGLSWVIPRLSDVPITAKVVELPRALIEVNFSWKDEDCSAGRFFPGMWDARRIVTAVARRWAWAARQEAAKKARGATEDLANEVAKHWMKDEDGRLKDWMRPMDEADAVATVMRS